MPDTISAGSDFNSRVAAPDTREVATALDNLKEYLLVLMNEKASAIENMVHETDKRYQQRFDAQEKAMTAAYVAVEQKTTIAFEASNKAIDKAEAAQKDKNEMTNEFRGQLADQANTFMPRKEVEAQTTSARTLYDALKSDLAIQRDELRKEADRRFDEVKKDIQILRESKADNEGRRTQYDDSKSDGKWVITTIFAIAGFFVATAAWLSKFLGH